MSCHWMEAVNTHSMYSVNASVVELSKGQWFWGDKMGEEMRFVVSFVNLFTMLCYLYCLMTVFAQLIARQNCSGRLVNNVCVFIVASLQRDSRWRLCFCIFHLWDCFHVAYYFLISTASIVRSSSDWPADPFSIVIRFHKSYLYRSCRLLVGGWVIF